MISRRKLLQSSAFLSVYGLCRSSAAYASSSMDTMFYHPVLHAMDMSILTYHMYGQSLVWPFDPYYEEVNKRESNRNTLMKSVWEWSAHAPPMSEELLRFGGYRGPGVLAGFPANRRHDPILYRYDRLNPMLPCLNFLGERWAIYESPLELVHNLKDVYVAFQQENTPTVVHQRELNPEGTDLLFCFEGGTGDKGEPNQPHSQSLMGSVLLSTSAEGYTVHISFRGSRSGKGSRSMRQAYSDHNARGNPDWITDLGTDLLTSGPKRDFITPIGGISRGFTHAFHAYLPNLLACLEKVAEYCGDSVPAQITISGHSLGGGLAQMLTSAILMGSGLYNQLSKQLQAWPWKNLNLITFGAPRVGDKTWAKELTVQHLESDFFSTLIKPTDDNALSLTDPRILERLNNPHRPAAFRILISTDPITTEKVAGGKHVGKTVYLNEDAGTLCSFLRPPSFKSHEMTNIRLQAARLLSPPSERWADQTWKYATMQDMHPDRIQSKKGSVEEYQKMIDVIRQFYIKNTLPFDTHAFEHDAEVFLKLLKNI